MRKKLKTLSKPLKVAPDFVVGQDGCRVRAGDYVLCGNGDVGLGIGTVESVDPIKQMAVVRLFPWLSPEWDGETYTLPASWLELDYDYMRRFKR